MVEPVVAQSGNAIQQITSDAESSRIFLARQPIFDASLEVVGYELLYRHAGTGPAVVEDATLATTKVIANTFLELGIENIIDASKKVFINLPRPYITGEMPMMLDPAVVVLEVLEDVFADQAAMDGVKDLVARGYTIALDDFVQCAENEQFIPLASVIKIDVLNMTESELRQQVASLAYFSGTLLAEKVETHEQYQLCRSLGFHLFQGYFFCEPKILEAKQLPAGRIALLTILAKLQDPDCELHDIEKAFTYDFGLSYRLLRIINSAGHSVGKKIESIQHALVLLGLNALRKWATLITLSSCDNQPQELISAALIRAKTCESVAAKLGFRAEAAFTVGMFSLLDAIMSQPLQQLVENLPLVPEVEAALLHREGAIGQLLTAVVQYEKGHWGGIESRYINEGQLPAAYREAVVWCGKVCGELTRTG